MVRTLNKNIMDSLTGNILGNDSPFRWSDYGGVYSFESGGSVMRLENYEVAAWRTSTWGLGGLEETQDNSGWVHFIVKNDVEIDVRIWTNRNGYFSGIDDDPSYNLKVDSNVFFGGRGEVDSYIGFTMRGNGMLSLDVNGDVGAHHITGSEFDTLSRTWYNLPRPEGDSFLAALPYGDGVNRQHIILTAQTLDYNLAKQEFWIEITAARQFDGSEPQMENWDGLSDDITGNSGAISGGVELSTPTIIDATEWSLVVTREFPDGVIVTEQTGHGSSWSVKMMQRNVGTTDQYALGQNKYAVFADGVIQSNSVSNDLIFTLDRFHRNVEATRTYWSNYDPTVKDPIVTNPLPSFDDIKLGLGVGFGAIAIILILIILARR